MDFFNFNNLDQEPSRSRTHEVKKKSQSTLKRNAARKQKFLEERMTYSARKQTSKTSFKCDQSDHKANCEVKLTKNIAKETKINRWNR